MKRTAVIICPSCRKIRKFGEWTELTYTDRLTVNSFTVEELGRTCDDCHIGQQEKAWLASNA